MHVPVRDSAGASGLPPPLRAGLESLSGADLSGVRVHYGASIPVALNARAYTRGRDIYVGPGEERLLAHEGWHAVQQQQGRVRATLEETGTAINDDPHLEREADAMGAKALRRPYGGEPARPSAASQRPSRTVQRAMKFELQTKNTIWRKERGKRAVRLGRKYGPRDYLVKGASGVRLESEHTGAGYLEFETEWSRKWPDLAKQIDEAVDMTTKMSKQRPNKEGRRKFPFDVGHLRQGSEAELERGVWGRKPGFEGENERILGAKESLEVQLVDGSWNAGIQSSESFELRQYESFLRQHEFDPYREPVITSAQAVLDAVNVKGVAPAELEKLRNFLLIVINYIKRGQGGKPSADAGAFASVKGLPPKQAFGLMSRTSFSSMYLTLLGKDGRRLFKEIVERKIILRKMGVKGDPPFFIEGYGKPPKTGPTVHEWLTSIYLGKDLLSVRNDPKNERKLSAAMGKYGIETEERKKDTRLVKFEVRASRMGVWKPASEWKSYARARFEEARTLRPRPAGKSGTGLRPDK